MVDVWRCVVLWSVVVCSTVYYVVVSEACVDWCVVGVSWCVELGGVGV